MQDLTDPSAAREWTWPDSLDAMQAARDHHKVLLENDHVRVLEAWVSPGDTVPVHTHRWPGALHIVSGGHFVRRDAKGTVLVDSRQKGTPLQAGTVLWGAALPPHTLENVGTQELRTITVEVKPQK